MTRGPGFRPWVIVLKCPEYAGPFFPTQQNTFLDGTRRRLLPRLGRSNPVSGATSIDMPIAVRLECLSGALYTTLVPSKEPLKQF